jgi:Tfp pilus assembly protein PilX
MFAFGISKHPRGAALVIVMLIMAVLLLAGTTFLTISSTESQIALNEQGSAIALSLAEAAIHKALAFYYANPNSTYAGETNTVLGGGTFTLTVTTVAGCTSTSARKIVATGSVPVRGGTAQVQLQVTLDRVAYPYRWAAFAMTPNQIVYSLWDPIAGSSVDRTDSELWIGNSALVDSFDSGAGPYDPTTNSGLHGNVGANGDVDIDYNSTVDGNVQAGDDVYISSSVTVTGGPPVWGLSPNPTDPGVPFPSITPPTPSGNLTVADGQTVTLPGGDSVNCNATTRICSYTFMKFGNNARLQTSGGPVTIYVTGPPITSTNKLADLGSNVTMGASGTQLQIVAKSDGSAADALTWVTGDGFRLYGTLYGKNTDIYLGSGSQIYGSIIGRTVRARNGSTIHYDQAMSNQAICTNGNFTILRGTWREVIPST